MSQQIKLYGGCAHGQVVTLSEPTNRRVDVVKPSPFHPSRQLPTCPHPLGPGPSWPSFTNESASYHIQTYAQWGHSPRRHRSIMVGLLEGCELLPRELADLNEDLLRTPWEFPVVSFLHDFDEWLAQATFRHFGVKLYRGRPWY
jgi:hypothetical protein